MGCKNPRLPNIFVYNPSVSPNGEPAPFTQGSLGRYRARRFFDTLRGGPLALPGKIILSFRACRGIRSPPLGLRILRLPSVAQDDICCHSEPAEESVPLPFMRMTAFTPVLRRQYDPPEDPVRKCPRCKLPRRSNYLARNRRNSCPSPHNTCRWDQYSCAHFLHRGKA